MVSSGQAEKRNRPPLSCEQCRSRKLKCDRKLPCDSCIRRGKKNVCQYAPNANRHAPDTRRGTVADRLKNIENLISSLAPPGSTTSALGPGPRNPIIIAGPAQPTPSFVQPTGNAASTLDSTMRDISIDPSSSSSAVAASDAGGVYPSPRSISTAQTTYADSNHWSSILQEIHDIREELSPTDNNSFHNRSDLSDEYETQSLLNMRDSSDGTSPENLKENQEYYDLVLGHTPAVSLEELMSSLPSRSVCDSLVSHYFNSQFTIAPILHPRKFQQEYEAFWESPSTTSKVWMGLLFAILSLAVTLYEIGHPEAIRSHDRPFPRSQDLSRRVAQCLLSGRYTFAKEHAIEAVMIHTHGRFWSKDADVDLWQLMGVVTHLAIRMGYHRDASKLPAGTPKLTPFADEMRRRMWVTIYQVDALASFQMGLPSMIPSESCDVLLPRNLDDSDFGPDSTELPEARPLTDHTTILYTLVKAPVMRVFKKIVRHVQPPNKPDYETTKVLDAELRACYAAIPDSYRYKSITRSFTDSPAFIMSRLSIELLYLKGIIVLHRQFLTDPHHTAAIQSRRACVDAALTILDRQGEIEKARQPSGQLHDARWMLNVLTTSDFILAAMVVSLDMLVQARLTRSSNGDASSPAGHPNTGISESELESEISAIRRTQKIWEAGVTHFTEARIADRALKATLQRVEEVKRMPRQASTTPSGVYNPSMDGVTVGSEMLSPSQFGFGDPIDWGFLDNQFALPDGPELDLESWVLDAGGWNGDDWPSFS